MDTKVDKSSGQCPFTHVAGVGRTNRDWWPNQLRLEVLHQHSAKSDPMGMAAWTKVMNADRFDLA
jgi:catalase (peroxidase I)